MEAHLAVLSVATPFSTSLALKGFTGGHLIEKIGYKNHKPTEEEKSLPQSA